jgi:hypothetical protein
MKKGVRMFINHSKLCADSNSLRLAVNRMTRPSALTAHPDCTCSPVRSREEKLTVVLIILSILALILTF